MYNVWDIETTIGTHLKRKGSPWHPDNFIVSSQNRRQGEKRKPHVIYDAAGELFRPGKSSWFIDLLDGVKVLVGFNIKFDLLWALQDPANLKAWMKWVADGGLVWDVQLAEYLLNGMTMEAQWLSLNEVAPRYGGEEKIDEIAKLWEAGVNTPDIDKDLLIEYGQGDIINTEIAFRAQMNLAKACGQLKSILLNMRALVATIEMERNGMKVDLVKGLKDAEELKAELLENEKKLIEFLPDDLPFEFNWGSSRQLSALIFGGTVGYKAKAYIRDDEGNLTYYQTKATHYVLKDGSTTADAPDGDDDERYSYFTSGKNAGNPKTKQITVPDFDRGPKERIEDFEYEFPGFTKGRKEWEGAVKGVYSVSAAVIEELEGTGIPFLELFTEVQAARKNVGTYYIDDDPKKPGAKKGMLTLVDPVDGIVHHSLNHTSTVTGRFSSSDPNLQNLPKEKKSRVKELFISRFKKGTIIQSDFSALEVYMQAILTLDKQLVKDLQDGLDMHCARLATAEGMEYEEVYRLCKTSVEDGNKDFVEWDRKRTHIKVFSFQRAYGAGATKISGYLKVDKEMVEGWIEADKARYPGVEKWYERLEVSVKRSRKATSRRIPHPCNQAIICQLGRGEYRTPDGKKYVWDESPSLEFMMKRGEFQSFSPTELRNYPVQGLGGEWMKAALGLLVREFYRRENFGGKALLVNTVHDAAYVDADDKVKAEAAACLQACMLESSTFMEWYFDWKLPVYVPTDTTWGMSMIEEHPIKVDGFNEEVESIRSHLRSAYMECHTRHTRY